MYAPWPSDLEVPSVFIEIGSGEAQWLDEVREGSLRDAILLLKTVIHPVAVGFEHHYPRQTALILSTISLSATFFFLTCIDELDESMVHEQL